MKKSKLQKRGSLSTNIVTSIMQVVISIPLVFVLYRYLYTHLGAEQLGVWSLIIASTSIGRISELGLSGSVVKFVAKYRSRHDHYKCVEIILTTFTSIALLISIFSILAYPLIGMAINKLSSFDTSVTYLNTVILIALLSFIANTMSGVLQASLDGCQRGDLKNYILIGCNIAGTSLSIILVKEYGIVGVALGQFVQALLVGLLTWCFLKKIIAELPIIPVGWSKTTFREMFKYAAHFQIASLATICFDPLAKYMIGLFGGLGATAYYDMSSQVIMKLRNLFIAGIRPLVPTIAESTETTPAVIRESYLKAFIFTNHFVIIFFWLLVFFIPLISVLLLGTINIYFEMFSYILIVGHAFSTIAAVSYFFNLGTGDVRWNTISHFVMLVFNISFGSFLGYYLGGHGVVISISMSFVVAGAITAVQLHERLSISLKELYKQFNFKVSVVGGIAIAVFEFSNLTFQGVKDNTLLLMAYALIGSMLVIAAVWQDKLTKDAYAVIRRKF